MNKDGIGFSLSEEQQQFKDLAAEFSDKEVKAVATQADIDEKLPMDLMEKAWETGLMNLHVPEEYGGPDSGPLRSMRRPL